MSKILFVVEGKEEEPKIIESINQCFFTQKSKNDIEYFVLPACTNIYSVWKKLKEDDWETDTVEVIKELCKKEVPEQVKELAQQKYYGVYLFFDYDGHANDIPKGHHETVISEMLQAFDNESEMGKLYISYPMVEALKDFSSFGLCNKSECMAEISDGKRYKSIVTNRAKYDISKFNHGVWSYAAKLFTNKICCLFDVETMEYSDYRKNISSEKIFEAQNQKLIKPERKVMIISGFPQFLIDYFGEDFWNEIVKHSKRLTKCTRRYS